MARSTRLFIGIGGHVVSIDSGTGEELWRTKLRTASITTVSVQGGYVLAGANGQLFCLDATTGEVRWHNKLKGLGMGLVAFASPDMSGTAAQMAHNAMYS